ncbi:MAG: DUF2306 domain-containing protein [Gemmatimonadales bacterium]
MTISRFAPRFWPPRPKYILFAMIAVMMLVVVHKDLILLDPSPAVREHYRIFKWWLLPHGVAGAAALFLGPVQFSDRLRRRWLPWHRLVGRIYVSCVVIAAPLGVYIEYVKYVNHVGSRALVIAGLGNGGLFAVTTLIGLRMIKRRQIAAHKRWMTRSYATALIFLEVRCVEESTALTRLLEWPGRALESHSISDLWLYIAFAPIAAQLVLLAEKAMARRALPAATLPPRV